MPLFRPRALEAHVANSRTEISRIEIEATCLSDTFRIWGANPCESVRIEFWDHAEEAWSDQTSRRRPYTLHAPATRALRRTFLSCTLFGHEGWTRFGLCFRISHRLDSFRPMSHYFVM